MIPFTNPAAAGYLPQFLDAQDPRPAIEQIDANYQHGGGWRPFTGFTMMILGEAQDGERALRYPGDPLIREVSRGWLREELIVLFEHDWVAVIDFGVEGEPTWEVARVD